MSTLTHTLTHTLTPEQIDACDRASEILRAHGMNVYVQGTEMVVFAASTNRWQEVIRVHAHGTTPDEIASFVAHKIADLVAGPHSHD